MNWYAEIGTLVPSETKMSEKPVKIVNGAGVELFAGAANGVELGVTDRQVTDLTERPIFTSLNVRSF